MTHIAIYVALVEFLSVRYIYASSIGFIAAIGVNYSLQYYFVFSSSLPHSKSFLRYLLVTVLFLGVNLASLYLFISIFKWHYLASQVLVICIISICNFIINKLFTYA